MMKSGTKIFCLIAIAWCVAIALGSASKENVTSLSAQLVNKANSTTVAALGSGPPAGKWTFISHGWASDGAFDDMIAEGGWMRELAQRIASLGTPTNIYATRWDTGGIVELEGNNNPLDENRHHVMLFDWTATANSLADGYAYAAADALVMSAMSWARDWDDNGALYALIGHSRGGVVSSEATRQLILNENPPEQVIYLDGEGGPWILGFQYEDGRFEGWDELTGVPIRFDNVYSLIDEFSYCNFARPDLGGNYRGNCWNRNLDQAYSHSDYFEDACSAPEGIYHFLIDFMTFDGQYFDWPSTPGDDQQTQPEQGVDPMDSSLEPLETVFNGDFEWESFFGESRAGWEGHGGSCPGGIASVDGTYAARLNSNSRHLFHNLFWLPGGDSWVMRLSAIPSSGATSDGWLTVRLYTSGLGNWWEWKTLVDVSETSDWLDFDLLEIPDITPREVLLEIEWSPLASDSTVIYVDDIYIDWVYTDPPTGACCISTNCSILTSADCVSGGGTYQGDNSTCSGNPCGGGGCPAGEIEDCNGNCCPKSWIADGYCDDGTYEWNGIPIYLNCDEFNCDGGDCDCGGGCPAGEIEDCNGNCCPDYWVGDGYCDDGTYEWNGIPIYLNCDEFNCDAGDCDCSDPVGACCYANGTCFVLTESQCSDYYRGDGTDCNPNLCDQPPSGACCIGYACYDGYTSYSCNKIGGEYYGDGSSCNSNPCAPPPTGACCIGSGCNENYSAEQCNNANGEYYGNGSDCNPYPCDEDSAACCFVSGDCFDYTPTFCIENGGSTQGNGTVCTANICPQPTGACCWDDVCLLYEQEDCEEYGGVYKGNGTTCEPNPCKEGACCFGIDCFVYLSDDCEAWGGEYQGDGVSCDPTPCQLPTGACCFADESCGDNYTSDDCTNASGMYQGDDSYCSSIQCPDSVGACCVWEVCSEVSEVECNALEGTYFGDNSHCSTETCRDADGVLYVPSEYDTIQIAVDVAFDGDEIIVTPGTYTSSASEVVNMLGKAVWLRSSDGADVTIIDGQNECRGIMCNSGETNETVIEGFTITNGFVTGGPTAGAGVLCENSSPYIVNCSIVNNLMLGGTIGWGGGIGIIGNSSAVISECQISSNTVYGAPCYPIQGGALGGGIFIGASEGSPSILHCNIFNNKVNSESCAWGGGLHFAYENALLMDTNVCGNTELDGSPDQIYGEYTDGGGNSIDDVCSPDCPDVNGDGTIGVNDLLAVIDAWGEEVSPADVNNDGIVDVSDLLIVVGNWGPCE